MRATLELALELLPLVQQVLGSLQALEREHSLRGETLQRRPGFVCQRLGALQHELADAVVLKRQRGRRLVLLTGDRLPAGGELERAPPGAEQQARSDAPVLAGDGRGGLDDRRANSVMLAGRGETARRAPEHELAPGCALAKNESRQSHDHESEDRDRAGDAGEDVELLGAAGVLDEEQHRRRHRGGRQQGQPARRQLLLALGGDAS